MNLTITANTDSPDVIIDYIHAKLSNGKEIDFDWDFSYIDRNDNTVYFTFIGLNINGEKVRGNLELFEGIDIQEMGLYSEEAGNCFDSYFVVTRMHFHDGEDEMTLLFPYIYYGKYNLNTDEIAEGGMNPNVS